MPVMEEASAVMEKHLSSLPPLEEGDDPDTIESDEPDTLPERARDEHGRFVASPVTDVMDEEDVLTVKVGDESEVKVETEEAVEEVEAKTEDTEGAKTETAEEPEEVVPDKAQFWDDLTARLQGLSEQDQADILKRLGYIAEEEAAAIAQEVAAAESLKDYVPVGAVEEALFPVIDQVVNLPKTFEGWKGGLEKELNDVLVAQKSALDVAHIQNDINTRIINHFAELLQYEAPKLDMKAVMEAVSKGQDVNAVLDSHLKTTFDKNKARLEQSKKARPTTASETANGHFTVPRNASMAEIAMGYRGLGMKDG